MNDTVDCQAEQMMINISRELSDLGKAIVDRDIEQIELHSGRIREKLTDLRPILARTRKRITPASTEMAQSAGRCEGALAVVRRTVRALLSFHRTVAQNALVSGDR